MNKLIKNCIIKPALYTFAALTFASCSKEVSLHKTYANLDDDGRNDKIEVFKEQDIYGDYKVIGLYVTLGNGKKTKLMEYEPATCSIESANIKISDLNKDTTLDFLLKVNLKCGINNNNNNNSQPITKTQEFQYLNDGKGNF